MSHQSNGAYLEQHVLQKVRNAIIARRLEPRPGVQPQTDSRSLRVRMLARHTQAAAQRRHCRLRNIAQRMLVAHCNSALLGQTIY